METVQLLPKGLIKLACGGYSNENDGFTSDQNCNKITEMLEDYMRRNNVAIIYVEGLLKFVPMVSKKLSLLDKVKSFFK